MAIRLIVTRSNCVATAVIRLMSACGDAVGDDRSAELPDEAVEEHVHAADGQEHGVADVHVHQLLHREESNPTRET